MCFYWKKYRKYVDAMEKEKTKNELDFLKAQFNPHFLFNSINSIYGHIDKGNPTARNMLITFSEMLRYQLHECKVDTINIDKEIYYIRNYVALQQRRKEEDLYIKLNITPEVKGFHIAPLLFSPFIENAFKYASCSDAENKVEIGLDKRSDLLLFQALNTRDKSNATFIKHSGTGINKARRRLELLYPDQHELQIDDAEKFYLVTLKIQLF